MTELEREQMFAERIAELSDEVEHYKRQARHLSKQMTEVVIERGQARAEVERLKSEIRMLKLLNPESPKSTRRWG